MALKDKIKTLKPVSLEKNERILKLNKTAQKFLNDVNKDIGEEKIGLSVNGKGHIIPVTQIEIASIEDAEYMYLNNLLTLEVPSGMKFIFTHKGKLFQEIFTQAKPTTGKSKKN